jgi:hypothetical protein
VSFVVFLFCFDGFYFPVMEEEKGMKWGGDDEEGP